jgi:hypothetical protein
LSLPGIRGLPENPPVIDLPRLVGPATPDMSEQNQRLDGFINYIKLHGSFRWRPEDGSSAMVLGGGKELSIRRSPLLTWYHDLFEQVLCAGDVRIFVIGYSFQDDHINRTIARAVQSSNAKIFVWDICDPLQLLKNVSIVEPGYPRSTIDLRPYLIGSASRPLAEVFRPGERTTPEFERIAASFF